MKSRLRTAVGKKRWLVLAFALGALGAEMASANEPLVKPAPLNRDPTASFTDRPIEEEFSEWVEDLQEYWAPVSTGATEAAPVESVQTLRSMVPQMTLRQMPLSLQTLPTAVQASNQTPLTMQPMQPADNQGFVAASIDPPATPRTVRPLRSRFTARPQGPAPVTLPAPDSADQLELAELIGPLASQQELFANLQIQGFDRQAPIVDADESRMQNLADGGLQEWQGATFTWAAPSFYHNPLYFEDVNLERYGQGANPWFQPFVSGAHFFATIPNLPYKLGAYHPCERVYTLGHYRPGDCNPHRYHYDPFTRRGLVYQGLAVAGLIWMVP